MIFQNFVRAFLKAAGHRYYKRVPYMTPKGKRYRYFYRVTSTHQGRHAFDEAHLVEGTKFALHGEGESEFHGHITKVDGDQVTYTIDDGPRKGEEVTTSRKELVAELNEVHGVQDKLTAERAKVKEAIAEAKRAGHGGVVRRLERRLRALGGEPEAQPEAPTPKQEAPKPKPKAEKQAPIREFVSLLTPDAEDMPADLKGLHKDVERAFLSGDETRMEEAKSALLEDLTRRILEVRPSFAEGQYKKERAELNRLLVSFNTYDLRVLEKREKRQKSEYFSAMGRRMSYYRDVNIERARVEEEKLKRRYENTVARREAYSFTYFDAPMQALEAAKDAREAEQAETPSEDNFETMPEPETQPAESVERVVHGADIPDADIATYRAVDRQGVDALSELSDDDLKRLRKQISDAQENREGAIEDAVQRANSEARAKMLERDKVKPRSDKRENLSPEKRAQFDALDAEYQRLVARVDEVGEIQARTNVFKDEALSSDRVEHIIKTEVSNRRDATKLAKDQQRLAEAQADLDTARERGFEARIVENLEDNVERLTGDVIKRTDILEGNKLSDAREVALSSDEGRNLILELSEAGRAQDPDDLDARKNAVVEHLLANATERALHPDREDEPQRLRDRQRQDERIAQTRWINRYASAVRALEEESETARRLHLEHVSMKEDSPHTDKDAAEAQRNALDLKARAEAMRFAYSEAPKLVAQKLRERDEARVEQAKQAETPSEDNFETMPEAQPAEPTPEETAEINRRAGESSARDRTERQERERARVRERSFHKLPSHDDARENHLVDNTRNLRGARDTRERLRGADPKAVSKAIDAPIPTDGSVKRYSLPNDGGLAVRVSGAGLSYQFRFPDGTVSDEHTLAVDLSKMNEKASIKIAQGLAASYYGGVNDKGEPRYFTPATQTDAELRRTTLADVARLNKAERDFDGFSELTQETRVQRDALDPITPRSDEINSLEDIDKKTLATLKRVRSKDKARTSMRQAARDGDGIFATDGHRIFYRRGMNFGEDGKPVAIDDKATKDELDQRPPNYATIVSTVERENVHAGTMSKETAKQLARALKISEGKKINESLVIRADREDSTLTFMHKGREIAKIPKADDMVEGDFVVSADYFRDALRDGGAVSVHLSPENPKAQYNPIRLTTMSGSHVIMPMRNP